MYLTPTEFAVSLGVSINTVYRGIADGRWVEGVHYVRLAKRIPRFFDDAPPPRTPPKVVIPKRPRATAGPRGTTVDLEYGL